jgi:hypothetical protein
MSRIARAFVIGYPHHITQRGNYRQNVFKSDKDCYLRTAIKDWDEYLRGAQDDKDVKNIREHTRSGWPCGNDVFVKEIESMLVRKLSANPRGRPCMRK